MSRPTDHGKSGEPDRHSMRRRFEVSAARIVDSITDELASFDRDWRFTYINEAALRSIRLETGKELTHADVVGKNVWGHASRPRRLGHLPGLPQRRTRATDDQFRSTVPSDTSMPAGSRYPSEDGVTVYSRDITDRKRGEDRLAYHAYLLENVDDAVIATDAQLAVTAWNKGAEQMYGWRADEALGRDIWEVVPVDLDDEQRAEALKELGERGRCRVEAVTYGKHGAPVSVKGITIALRGANTDSAITGYVNIRRDVTERQRAEAARREANEKNRIGSRGHYRQVLWDRRPMAVYVLQ